MFSLWKRFEQICVCFFLFGSTENTSDKIWTPLNSFLFVIFSWNLSLHSIKMCKALTLILNQQFWFTFEMKTFINTFNALVTCMKCFVSSLAVHYFILFSFILFIVYEMILAHQLTCIPFAISKKHTVHTISWWYHVNRSECYSSGSD